MTTTLNGVAKKRADEKSAEQQAAVHRPLEQGKFAHDVAGARGRIERLADYRPIIGIAIERSEGMLVEALHHHRLFCVSPKMSARARERYRLAPSKSDAFDAFVLTDSLRHEHRHWRPLAVPSPLLAELRALTRDRQRLIWNQRDVENQLRAIECSELPSGRPAPVLQPGP